MNTLQCKDFQKVFFYTSDKEQVVKKTYSGDHAQIARLNKKKMLSKLFISLFCVSSHSYCNL